MDVKTTDRKQCDRIKAENRTEQCIGIGDMVSGDNNSNPIQNCMWVANIWTKVVVVLLLSPAFFAKSIKYSQCTHTRHTQIYMGTHFFSLVVQSPVITSSETIPLAAMVWRCFPWFVWIDQRRNSIALNSTKNCLIKSSIYSTMCSTYIEWGAAILFCGHLFYFVADRSLHVSFSIWILEILSYLPHHI